MRFAWIFLVLIGCAHDVRARFPSSPREPTGTLVLLLSQSASNVSVAIDGLLVVEDAHTRKLTIERVPTGHRDIAIAANGSDKAMRAWIASEHPTTIPLGVPESGAALWKSLVGTLVSIVAYSMLR
jgi:hypothetical protein